MAKNGRTVQIVLIIAVASLAGYSLLLSRRLSALEGGSGMERIRVKTVELVQPSGKVVGMLEAGIDGGRPQIKLLQEDDGHFFEVGFAANGTGPYLEMLADFNTGDGPETRIEIGAFDQTLHGVRIQGREAREYPPPIIGWATSRAREPRYVISLPNRANEKPKSEHVSGTNSGSAAATPE